MEKETAKLRGALGVVKSADGVPHKREKFTISAKAKIARARKARWKAIKTKEQV